MNIVWWWRNQPQSFRERYWAYWKRHPSKRVYRCWGEGIERKPVEGKMDLFKGKEWWNAKFSGTPFRWTYSETRIRLDEYYMNRLPWRRWQKESLACAARRVWGAGI